MLLFACSPFAADVTSALAQREQQLCASAIKSGKAKDCVAAPYNVNSNQLKLNDAAKSKGVTAAWCAQYDYAQSDTTNFWTAQHDAVLVTQAQDLSYAFTPIANLPPDGCASYQMP